MNIFFIMHEHLHAHADAYGYAYASSITQLKLII